ncbi:hypothetical protein [Inquilinus sp. CAU 1745]|uniref:hypothetical protein n=1 Tax=Inquilinus sp. CAU 1745 TaxID=3140369 RepID=UPI00325A89DB
MPASSKADTFTFRLDPALKSAFTRSAASEHRRPAELLRDLMRDHLARNERRAFEEEARRQSLVIAAAARDPESDEARVIRELENDLDAFGDEWK